VSAVSSGGAALADGGRDVHGFAALLEAERAGNEEARLGIDVFCYRVRKQIGSSLAVLGGADAIVFGGGIGENAPAVRSRSCSGMEWCGIALDESRNRSVRGREGRVGRGDSRIGIYVIPADETLMIARDTARCLGFAGRDVGCFVPFGP
jgi:acetate kinase